jgi:hypothetical protein
MNKECDKLKPLRRIDQGRSEYQANDRHGDDAEQPRLGWADEPNESRSASEHLQHK